MKRTLLLFFPIIGLLWACTSVDKNYTDTSHETSLRDPAAASEHYEKLRGNRADYDPGAPKNSSWAKLYASAPNYRQVGKAVLGGGGEKFRWEMGPMWYRGRLGKNQVKVFVVGQEGAQDENVSNRAFTGSTGTKTQKFLNHIGIFRSYLFMNTFVYTINGQLDGDPKFNFLEQGIGTKNPELSPIVKYRHELFDNMLLENSGSVALFMGVGSGGKASLATWINARGGNCSAAKELANCDTANMVVKGKSVPKVLVIGVPHPGGASAANGGTGALANIVNGFTSAANRVAEFKQQNPNWLPFDSDDDVDEKGKKISESARLSIMRAKYNYKDAGVPYRDFAFGTNKQMGATGTTSNRWKADSIQVFSTNGVYGDKSAKYNEAALGNKKYSKISSAGLSNSGFKTGVDMPWEPPKYGTPMADAYDPGPCENYNPKQSPCRIADMMMNGWSEDLFAQTQSSSFGPTSLYRGNLQNPEILIIADQTSHDDFFSGRALTGEVGQKLQTWLEAKGVRDNYAIIRTSPFDTLIDDSKGTYDEALLNNPVVEKKITELIKEVMKNGTQEVYTIGKRAQELAAKIAPNVKAIDVEVKAKNISAIPRKDLPYHTRWWMGTSGNRAVRGNGGSTKGSVNGKYHYYRFYAPDWNNTYAVPSLDSDVVKDIKQGLQELEK
ncbi:MAG: hypothetical protein AABY53_02205 [Bdellovibrionota bacterium]